ncbi:hypothetical protein LTR56_025634 [Elasticomyces elasticus]|nr:hypothetical protein LTR56_025634 [Elasticomyces elasticus]KAK3632175.1 hypothetical protein LTR22_020686 [Elasticomyces elasticus]KAK4904206.1 hypothetical protein LTR49_026297 [Elasticomyces elasticus]KAK5739461.1 hypothetical protein LTS12_025283 [Elasticomyces elasticus]
MDDQAKLSSDEQKRLADHRMRFFVPELEISDSTKEVLVKYSKILEDQLQNHVESIAIHPYPCIGMGRFLNLHIGRHQLYQSEILPRMLNGDQTYLDLGCAFAQDIRRLVADGVDSSKCYGADLRLDFLELGYELFNDRNSLKSRFIAADIFDEDSPLKELYGQIDIIDASSFFHLFTLGEQKQVARSVIKLMRPRKDGLVVGRQVGNVNPQEYPRRNGLGTRFRHDIVSWRKMWDEVGEETGVRFNVGGDMQDVPNLGTVVGAELEGESAAMMEFYVRRLE